MSVNSTKNVITMKQFFENTPPGKQVDISDFWAKGYQERTAISVLNLPELSLYCENSKCEGERLFHMNGKPIVPTVLIHWLADHPQNYFITYGCSNCRSFQKHYSIAVFPGEIGRNSQCYKFGELPAFGPQLPRRLSALLGGDRENFLKGLRSENQTLGIGAYAYYRRVVENGKTRIFEQIKKVAEKTEANESLIKTLDLALKETQFSKAVEMIKGLLPETLKIKGHSPLTLLHSAISEGIHELSDEECLAKAYNIRIVLTELADRLDRALRNDAEITRAISDLAKKGKSGSS